MERSSLKIKSIPIFFKKIFLLDFGKWNFLAPTLKNFLYFRWKLSKLQKEKKSTLIIIFVFQEIELSSPKLTKFLYFF